MNALRVEDLTKKYPKFTLQNVSFTLEQGRIMGLIGKNGAGKSTALKSILNLVHPDGGRIEILGLPCPEREMECKQRMGVVLGGIDFYLDKRLAAVMDVTRRFYQNWDEAACRRYMDEFAIDPSKRVRELSAGMRVKALVALALSHRAELFIFDEPTSGLDPLMQTEFFKLIREYVNQGATCMLSTHVLPEVKRYCHRVAIMKEGRLQSVESVAELTRAGAKRIKWVRDGVEEEFLYEKDLNELYRELMGHDIRELLIEEPSLEEVFIQYYRN